MRFYDFLHDIDETSARIAMRDMSSDVNAAVRLTLKTLMRPDVLHYFDALLAGTSITLPDIKRLLFYVVLFGYTVNVRPRPGHADLVDFTARTAVLLESLDFSIEKKRVLCETSSLPRKALNALSAVFNTYNKSGLYCFYSANRPADAKLQNLFSPKFSDASLILYESGKMKPLTIASERLVYDGPIFTSKTYSLSGLYIRSLL